MDYIPVVCGAGASIDRCHGPLGVVCFSMYLTGRI